ncbi:MAG: hypothetical protein H6585_00305 [Flavobacteriales bacterium]|nr:hypothetical protein [Flavobacteriales bacterium]MCB9446766.1 hypothetical protein [Flavobacteriales bacterium]
MDSKQLIEEIRELADHLKKQTRHIQEVDSLGPQDLDTLLSISGELYEKMAILKFLRGGYDAVSSVSDDVEEEEKVAVTEKKPEVAVPDKPHGYGIMEPTTPSSSNNKANSEEATAIPPVRNTPKTDTQPAEPVEQEAEEAPKTQGDLFTGTEKTEKPTKEKKGGKTILDNMMGNEKEVLASNLGRKTIRDLKSAIGIHDRFRFINDLFGGNMDEYEGAVESLTAIESLEAAHSYLKPFKEKYQWGGKESAEEFFDLVDRRFKG